MESELLVAKLIGGRSARFEVEGSSDPYFVIRFSGTEAVSELYEFRIEVATRFIGVEELVGLTARLRLAGVGETPREVHGLICRAEYLSELTPRSLYRITLVPALWRLKLRTNSRIFQQKSTPDILAEILSESGIEYQSRLAATYAPRDYCVQYRESDLAFIRRLMEEDGIAFYFEHTQDGHTLVLSDSNTGRVKIEGETTLSFRTNEQVRSAEHVRRFSLGHQITSGGAAVRDYDLYTSQDIDGRAGGEPELYDAPIGSRDVGHATNQAKLRLEEARVIGAVATGTSDCPRLVPGHSFTLAGHIRGELDGEYHVLRTDHRGEQPRILYADAELVYDNDFVAVPVATPYRPPRVTPRPTIRGVQTATVVGPAGEEIYVDEQGRVKVQFHWDRSGQYNESSSCWVRVSQAWAGQSYGAMFIPRIGHEVLVEFIEGDPNRPIITGRIYDGTRPTPYPLPDEKTRSTIKSDSSPGGGGFNELRFEDAKGCEEIFIHAQLDMNTMVLQNATRLVGNDDTESVAVNQTQIVGGNQENTIHANQATTVAGSRDILVGGDQTTSVSGHTIAATAMDHALAVGGNQHIQVQGLQTIEVGMDQMITVLQNTTASIGMMLDGMIGTDAFVTIGANYTLAVAADQFVTIGGNDTLTVGINQVHSVTGERFVSITGNDTLTAAAEQTVAVGANQTVTVGAARTVTVGAGDTLTVAGPLTISAQTITLSAGGGTITIGPAGVSINGALVKVNS